MRLTRSSHGSYKKTASKGWVVEGLLFEARLDCESSINQLLPCEEAGNFVYQPGSRITSGKLTAISRVLDIFPLVLESVSGSSISSHRFI